MRNSYQYWSEAEVRVLQPLFTASERTDWGAVLELLPGRSKQQCISFVNNGRARLRKQLSRATDPASMLWKPEAPAG